VLCDYQLANHRTGAQALTAVRNKLARSGHEGVVTLLITGDMASAELAALALQGIPVLHKPVTAARLRRTLDMLWQQAERDKARVASTPESSAAQMADAAGAAGRMEKDASRDVAGAPPFAAQREARHGQESASQREA
jgi:hypothetical protein